MEQLLFDAHDAFADKLTSFFKSWDTFSFAHNSFHLFFFQYWPIGFNVKLWTFCFPFLHIILSLCHTCSAIWYFLLWNNAADRLAKASASWLLSFGLPSSAPSCGGFISPCTVLSSAWHSFIARTTAPSSDGFISRLTLATEFTSLRIST